MSFSFMSAVRAFFVSSKPGQGRGPAEGQVHSQLVGTQARAMGGKYLSDEFRRCEDGDEKP